MAEDGHKVTWDEFNAVMRQERLNISAAIDQLAAAAYGSATSRGMRDTFAGLAMQALITAAADARFSNEALAATSYAMADAMMAERAAIRP